MFVIYDKIEISDKNLKLQFHTKFISFIFSVGILMIFIVAYLSLKGLKSDFDNSFPKPLHQINLLNEFQNKYMLETISLLQNESNLKSHHTESTYLWQVYKNKIYEDMKQGNKVFMLLRDVYQHIFLSNQFHEIQKLRARERKFMQALDNIITTDSIGIFYNQNMLLYNAQRVSELSFSISDTQVAIYTLEKTTTDNFHMATLGMLWAVTLLVFGIVVTLSLVILNFIQRLNGYLKRLFDNAIRDLRNLNAHLQEEVDKQIQVIREKDAIMYVQSKLASMGEMIQNIAHQWRQPLNSLTLLIQGIKSKYDNNKLTREIIHNQTQLALNIAQNMSSTIDNFRNFFRLDTGFEYFNITHAVKDAIEINKPMFDSLKICIDFDDSDEIVLFGSKHALMQILLVLFSNSKDAFIERKISEPKCFVTFATEQNYAIIRYYDNAGGIADTLLDKIFEPYFTTKHKSLGTGIGLYMAKEILANHLQGSIEVKNYHFSISQDAKQQEYKGALFVLKLRLIQ